MAKPLHRTGLRCAKTTHSRRKSPGKKAGTSRSATRGGRNRRDQVPIASETHFFMWLVLAAPASFLDAESGSQAFLASDSHFVMKLFSAAPASFLSAASPLQVANALVATSESAAARTKVFMDLSCCSRIGENPMRSMSVGPPSFLGKNVAGPAHRGKAVP